MNQREMEARIEKALDRVRPYLQADGGDVKLISISDDGVVRIEMTGACDGCPYSMQTLKAGIEENIRKDIPEVKEVIAINK